MFHKLADIDQYITEEEDESNQSRNSGINSQIKQNQMELYLLAAQIAPIMDRIGRAMLDTAPLLAQIGQKIQSYIPA